MDHYMQNILQEKYTVSLQIAVDNANVPSLSELETAHAHSSNQDAVGVAPSPRQRRSPLSGHDYVAQIPRRKLSSEEHRVHHRKSRWNAVAAVSTTEMSGLAKKMDDCPPTMMLKKRLSRRRSLMDMSACLHRRLDYFDAVSEKDDRFPLQQTLNQAVAISMSPTSC